MPPVVQTYCLQKTAKLYQLQLVSDQSVAALVIDTSYPLLTIRVHSRPFAVVILCFCAKYYAVCDSIHVELARDLAFGPALLMQSDYRYFLLRDIM